MEDSRDFPPTSKLLPISVSLLLLLPALALASDPPKNTGHATPPVWIKPAVEWFDNRAVTPDPNAQAGPLIVAGYGSSFTSARTRPQQPAPRGGTALRPGGTAEPSVPLAGSHRYRLRIAPTDVSTGSPRLIYSWIEAISNTDTEPVIIANDISGTTYQVAAFHHNVVTNGRFVPWIHTSYATTANSSGFSPSSPNMLYVPSGYGFGTDPYLAENSFDDGIAPRRIYVTGCLDSTDGLGNAVAPSAVRVWYSDNGGQSWNGGWSIVSRDTGQIFDRDTAAVSEYSGTRGYFYDAYVDTTGSWSLYITSSTNGVTPFCNAVPPIRCYPPQLTTALVSTRDTPFNPQIVINPTTGRLYVLWWTETTPYGNTEIRMRRSSDWSVTNLEVDGNGNPSQMPSLALVRCTTGLMR
jgi:hypothetical protein